MCERSTRLSQYCLTFTRSTALKFNTIRAVHQKSSARFGICFDVDGVFIQGDHVIPEAKEAIKMLSCDGRFTYPVLFVTNSSAKDSQKAAYLSNILDIEVDTAHIVHAQTPLSMYTSHHNKHMLVLGQGDLHGKASDLGFNYISTLSDIWKHFPLHDVTNPTNRDYYGREKSQLAQNFPVIDGVILMGEPELWGSALQICVDVLQTNGNLNSSTTTDEYNIALFGCNPDLLYKHKIEIPRFGQGAFLLALETLYKKTTNQSLNYTGLLGKPSEVTFCYADYRLRKNAKRLQLPNPEYLYMIGDNPCADIAGANLYNEYLKTSHNNKTLPTCRIPPTEITNAIKSDPVKSIESLLVCTGVYQTAKSNHTALSIQQSHRDFPLTVDLLTPTQTYPTVLQAVQYILDNHRI